MWKCHQKFAPCSQMQGKLFVLLLDKWHTVNPFKTREVVSDVKFLERVLRILRSLERRRANEDLARPVRTDIVAQPHGSTMLALAKILAGVFCSMMLDHEWEEK